MGHFKSNLRDIEFNLFEVLRRQDVLGAEPFAEVDEETARGILDEVNRLAEGPIAASFADASKSYVDNPTALHLRGMNMLFEGLKEKGALVIVPSSAVESMNLGGLSGMVALAQANKPKEG